MKRAIAAVLLLNVLIISTAPVALAAPDTEKPKGEYAAPLEGDTINVGDTYKMNFAVTDNVAVTDAVVYLDGKRVNSGDSGLDYGLTKLAGSDAFDMTWDLTKVKSGTHTFQVYLSDAAGNESLVLTKSKADTIKFVVSNTTQPTMTTTTETPKSSCSVSQGKFDEAMEPIVSRVKKQEKLLDQTYGKLKSKLGADADVKLDSATKLKDGAEQSITDLAGMKVDCSKDPRSDLDAFKTALEQAEQDLTSYRQELQQVIEATNNV